MRCREGGGERSGSLSSQRRGRARYCPAARCCRRLDTLLHLPCPHALPAFPVLFILCHQSSDNPPCETLFPSPLSEVSTVLKTGAASKKKTEKETQNYRHINFYSNGLAAFSSSFAGDQGSLPAPQPSIPQDTECWHKPKPGDLPLGILSLAGVSVR